MPIGHKYLSTSNYRLLHGLTVFLPRTLYGRTEFVLYRNVCVRHFHM